MNERLSDEQLLYLLKQVDIQAMRIPSGVRKLADLICEKIQTPESDGWKEATIAWEVCASIHREYAKKKDPFFTTRQADFVKHTEAARAAMLAAAAPDQFRDDTTESEKVSEQSAFEDWLEKKSPSGDSESVQRQWERSSEFEDWLLDQERGAAAPDHFRDAAEMMAAPAEVPMPEPDASLHDDGHYLSRADLRTSDFYHQAGWRLDVISMAKASTYGDAREAAGYARGLKSRVPLDAINKMLSDGMDVAVANGANSVSMPDHYVEVAAWTCGIKDAASAPADVPMPQGYAERPADYTGDVWIESQMRTYGVACRAAGDAAGYARGLREMLDCRTCRNYTRDGCIQTAQCVNGDGYRRAMPVRFWSAALRGEVK